MEFDKVDFSVPLFLISAPLGHVDMLADPLPSTSAEGPPTSALFADFFSPF